MAYDEDGQLLNASFMDFPIPYATEVPEPVVLHTETSSPLNPLGVKGVGEAGTIPVSAVIAGAVEDALGARGLHAAFAPEAVRARLRAGGGPRPPAAVSGRGLRSSSAGRGR